MSGTTYKQGATVYQANRFQPNCCSSLIYAWFGAMRIGEAAGEEWCRKAHREAEHSPFYAHHIARNDLIQGQTKLTNVKKAVDFATKAEEAGKLPGRSDLLFVATQVREAIAEPIQKLRNQEPEAEARRIMGFRVVQQWTENVETQLGLCLKQVSATKRFYMLGLVAENRKGARGRNRFD